MNTGWFPFAGVTPPVLADLLVQWVDLSVDAPGTVVTLTASDGLVLEAASTDVKAFYNLTPSDYLFRVRGLPFSAALKRLDVRLLADRSELWSGDVGGPTAETDVLYALFAAAPGLTPVVFDVRDGVTGDPIEDVEITVWDASLSTPLVPLLRTTTAGQVKCGLPPGSYKIFAFKPYSSFAQAMPVSITVASSPVTVSLTLTQSRPALPTVPRVTLFGWVLRPDYVPVAGTEVKLRLLSTPQLAPGGAGLSRYEMVALTDAEGRFELFPVAATAVLLTCEAVGYSRKGLLPPGGSLNWKDFSPAGVPA